MSIKLKEKCVIEGLNKEELAALKNLLTIANPVFGKRMDMQLSIFGIPKYLKFYNIDDSGVITIPIGAINEATGLIKNWGKHNVSDLRTDIGHQYFSKLKFIGELRKYQEDAIKAAMPNTNGVIEAMTGSGKTVIFVAMTVQRKKPTLILVNTIELANQTINSFLKFTNAKQQDIGFIGDGRFEVKPITVGIHQTMAKLSDEKYNIINKKFSQVIADEVHICPARTYFETMTKLQAKYKFGFSATPKREDGLTPLIHYATGPTIHVVNKEELVDVLIKPSYHIVETSYFYPLLSSTDYQFMIADLSEDNNRNLMIYNHWIEKYNGKSTIMLCSRLSQINILHNMFQDTSVVLHSKMKKKERALSMSKVISGEKPIVISTYGLFSTGIDVPRLEVLFLCAPMRSEIKLKQAAGRLMRMCAGKVSADIVDFYDKKVDLLKFQFYKRSRVLKNL